MSLREYQRKRHFNRTPEPQGTTRSSAGRSYVIQKHDASHLHYDFRLELDGVLKSWAVPKGPCLDPLVKRLAMHVEDHPVAYGSFEGTIPEGEYGGGTVMLWDRGEWEPIGDAAEGYRAGKLKFRLHGEKLHGGWMLLRTGGKNGNARQWLLVKERDDDARPLGAGDILEEMPLSVSTGRDLPDIAAARPPAKGKAKPAKPKKVTVKKTAKQTSAKADALPSRVEVQLATRADKAPAGDDWLHEVKFDGYRIICRLDRGRVKLLSRNHKDWTERFALVAESMRGLPMQRAIFDGEIVALREDGISDFQTLQNAFRERRADLLHYFIFDLLYLDGRDLREVPLIERKKILADLFDEKLPVNVHVSDHMEGSGPEFLQAACKKGLEGIICKRSDRPYVAGRGDDWVKVKCVQTGEFVIGGYTDPGGARVGFGALLVGYHDAKGDLIYAGKVGTGYDERTLRDVLDKLQHLQQGESPFKNRRRQPKGTHWVTPKLVGQFTYGSQTRDGILRHAVFQGLREDKPAREVTREKVQPLAAVLRNGKTKKSAAKKPAVESNGHATYDAASKQFAGVRLTSPEKILYPEDQITKLELATYFQQVSKWMLPHVADRPLVLVRCPDGQGEACFFQKHPGVGTPDTLRRIRIKENTKEEEYVVADDAASLISLAQMGALEIHAWGSHTDELEKPDRLIFDLDPDPEVPWERVVDAARQVRDFLKQLGLVSFVKTTGGKGLHLVAPIERRHDWEEAKAFCKQVADAIVRADPHHFTANMIKTARHDKIYVDYLRNSRGATAVVPYSPRSRPGAPVSTPLTWEELSPRIRSDHYTIRTIMKRLASLKRDPWARIGSTRQSLDKPIARLRELLGPE